MGELDALVQKIQNLPPWNIYWVHEDGTTAPWYAVDGGIAAQLVIREDDLRGQVEAVPAQIMQWGRLAGQAKRIWEIAERRYRIWRDQFCLALASPDGKPTEWKKPTAEMLDRLVRSDPEYEHHYREQERAEDAYQAALAVLDGFRAKKELLRTFAVRYHEQGAPQLSI